MAALILDSSSPDSPWVARARSQLVGARAYDTTVSSHWGTWKLRPPMITASLGFRDTWWRKNGDEILLFLAARGGKHLLTKTYIYHGIGGQSLTPLDFALTNDAPPDEPFSSDEQARIIALIKSGALATRTTIAPPATFPYSTIPRPWEWHGGLRCYASDDRAPQVKFMGDCWDAAVERRHGEIDAQFVDFWARRVGQCLPDLNPRSFPPTSCPLYEYHMSAVRNELEAYASLVSLFESKSPGFAQHPDIRSWLDRRLFQRSSRSGVNHTSLKGDWSHLM